MHVLMSTHILKAVAVQSTTVQLIAESINEIKNLKLLFDKFLRI